MFSYFRLLCMRAQKKDAKKIGREGDIVEMDESQCGNCKYWLGDSRKRRRRAWIIGGMSRLTGRQQEDKKALWLLIKANFAPKTDG